MRQHALPPGRYDEGGRESSDRRLKCAIIPQAEIRHEILIPGAAKATAVLDKAF
jgi:hypothetical protein